MPSVLPRPLSASLRALASSFIPEIDDASAAEWAALESAIERALAARPETMRRQLGLFVRLLDATARLRYRASLRTLDAARRTSLLEAFARSPVLRFRRGIWGLRTLIMLGWYTQPTVVAALGYRADKAGWDARR
jgi:hypothetical protein